MRRVKSRLRRLWTRSASRTVQMRSDVLVALFDVALTALAFGAMLVLRFDGSVPDSYWSCLLYTSDAADE